MPVLADVADVEEGEGLEIAIVREVEGDQDGHDLARGEAPLPSALAGFVRLNQARLAAGQELLAEVVDVAEEVQ